MLRAIIGDQTVSRAAVQAWEDRRTAVVRKKVGLPPSTAHREEQRRELLARKEMLGHARLRARMARGLWLSDRVSRFAVAVSGKARRLSVCEIEVSAGSAEDFARWFEDRNALNDERSMIDACPDHYIIARDVQGLQLVVETTGGSPLPSEFTVDYSDVSSLLTPPDPSYPHQVAGVARLCDGLPIGGVRHQFRQEGSGFRALLTVEFPARMPRYMVEQHRWHLATEFSNWIEEAQRSQSQPPVCRI